MYFLFLESRQETEKDPASYLRSKICLDGVARNVSYHVVYFGRSYDDDLTSYDG